MMAEAKVIAVVPTTKPKSGCKSFVVKILTCKSFAIRLLHGFCAEHMRRTRMFTDDCDIGGWGGDTPKQHLSALELKSAVCSGRSVDGIISGRNPQAWRKGTSDLQLRIIK
jgi:hypothetical protein